LKFLIDKFLLSIKMQDINWYQQKRFYQILGVRISPEEISDVEIAQQILREQGQEQNFISLIEFCQRLEKGSLGRFLFKLQAKMTEIIGNWPEYQNLKVEGKLPKNRGFYAHDGNDGLNFISFDIRGANYACLRMLKKEGELPIDWSDFFRLMIPEYDQRSHKEGKPVSSQGYLHVIPECIYQSKYVRLFVLTGLKKLNKYWTSLNWQVVEAVRKIISDQERIYWNTDEVIIQGEESGIIKQLKEHLNNDRLFSLYRIQTFKVNKFFDQEGKRMKNEMILTYYENGNRKLVNINEERYNLLNRQL